MNLPTRHNGLLVRSLVGCYARRLEGADLIVKIVRLVLTEKRRGVVTCGGIFCAACRRG